MKRSLNRYLIPALILLLPLRLCADEVITISTSYYSLLSNTENTGMLDLLLKEAFFRIGYKAEFVQTYSSNSLEDVNSGLADAEINRVEGMETRYPNLIRVPEPNMLMDFVAFSERDFLIDGWESIRHLYVGIVRGWKILEESTAGFQHLEVVPSEEQLFRMLEKGRLDVAIYSKLSGLEIIRMNGWDSIHPLSPPLISRPMYLYLHKSHADLAEPLAGALKAMKRDGSYEQIVRSFENR